MRGASRAKQQRARPVQIVLLAWKADICKVAVSPTAMSLAVISSLYSHRSTALEENDMTATYTFDVFSSLDGYGAASANWTGYWGKQGPELLDRRLALYDAEQRMVFGANTYRAFARMPASSTEESVVRDPWVTRMRSLPATVVSTTLEGPSTGPTRPS
jgi:hypothetical protein